MRISDWSSDVCSSDLLALALRPHASPPPMLWGRSPEKTRSAAASVGAVAEPDLDRLVAECDIIAIAVADDALAEVVSHMASALPASRSPFVFHVSGRSGAAVLQPLDNAGAMTAAIQDRKSTRLNSSHSCAPRMPASA